MKKSHARQGEQAEGSSSLRMPEPSVGWASVLTGVFLGLALLKFGNPVVLDKMVEVPRDLEGVLFQPWPARWAYFPFLGLVAVVCFLRFKHLRVPRGLAWMPLGWLLWQALASAGSVDPAMSRSTLIHFGIAVGMYYLGYCLLGFQEVRAGMMVPMLLGFGYVLWIGMDQHFGGLAASREHFFKEHPNWEREFPPEFIKKIQSDRIFSTLVYPNALAGAILLLLPVLGAFTWEMLKDRRRMMGLVGLGALIYGGGACLIWSGSKAGWLIALGVIGLVGWRYSENNWKRWSMLALAGGVGLGFFLWRYEGYFARGATSVGARFDYWSAAWNNAKSHPGLGTGPGSFAKIYAQVKRPESEMARLVHNDYLQQASDSGWVGALLFVLILPGSLLWLYRYSFRCQQRFWPWLGLVGFGVQSTVEFGLYIPALIWLAFFWLGGLMADGHAQAQVQVETR